MNKNRLLKICALLLAAAMLLSFVGCGRPAQETPVDNSSDVSSSQTPTGSEPLDDDSFEPTSSDDDAAFAPAPESNSAGNGTAGSTTVTEEKVITTVEDAPYDAEKNPLKQGVNFSLFEMHNNVGYDHWIFQSKYYDALREKGFDHVRLPVDFFDYTNLNDAPNYPIDEEALRMIDTIINTALSAGLKIVLDFHHFGVLQKNYTVNREKYLKIWEQLSVHYQSYPSGLVFELINEPGNPNTVRNAPDPINPTRSMILQEEAIEIIRKTNPNRLIVHATKLNNAVSMLNETTLPDDDNIILSVHTYEPYTFTHQGTDWLSDEFSKTRPYDDDVRAELEAEFAQIAAFQERTGRPVWIGEFGVTNKADAQDRRKYAELINELSEKYKVGWCWFEFSTGFGIYNIEKDEWTADGVVDALTK